MRVFKFRAWDKFNAQYWNSEEYNNLGDFFKKIQHFIDGGNDLIIEQFTGLKDKNGKQIYEGDIVEFVGGTCDFLIDYYSRHEKGKILAVKLLKSGFTLIPCPTDFKSETPNTCGFIGNYNFWNNARSLIVIGNIYENPELLNQ